METTAQPRHQHHDFGQKIISCFEQVKPYVKHRLYTAETTGIVPRNMYNSTEIIDDAVVVLYEKFEGKLNDVTEIKHTLFSLVNDRLDALFKKEAFHKDTVSISQILDNELKMLEEKFEMDANQDLLMEDEFDDISYHQSNFEKPFFLYAEAEKDIVNVLGIYDIRIDLSEEKRKALNKIYSWLPLETSNILDLFIFGKLSYTEIAQIKNVDTREIKSIIQSVSRNFRKNLN